MDRDLKRRAEGMLLNARADFAARLAAAKAASSSDYEHLNTRAYFELGRVTALETLLDVACLDRTCGACGRQHFPGPNSCAKGAAR